MTPVDRDILQLLENGEEPELALNPTMIAENTDWKAQTIREHLVVLRDHDMVQYRDKDRAVHVLSERGRAFLNGDEDPQGDDFDDEE
jgi:DNA-binding IclR family transcriptional regulator